MPLHAIQRRKSKGEGRKEGSPKDNGKKFFKYLVANATWIYISYRGTVWRLMRKFIHINISDEVCLWFCRLDVIVLGFKSVEELYFSPQLGVYSADTIANCPCKKKNFARILPIIPINSPAVVLFSVQKVKYNCSFCKLLKLTNTELFSKK